MSENNQQENKERISRQVVPEPVEISEEMKKIVVSIRKNFITVAPYQGLIAGILFAVMWAVLNPLDGMDIGYPLIHIARFPSVQLLGIVLLLFTALNILFALGLPLLLKIHQKQALIIGYILSACMIPFVPTGTYFGIYSLLQVHDLSNRIKNNRRESENLDENSTSFEQTRKNLKQYLVVSGFSMLHMPIILLIFYLFVITMPIDMAYPAAAASATAVWELFAWILFSLYIVEIIVGSLISKISNKTVIKILGWIFASYQSLALGIFIMAFAIASIMVMQVDSAVQVVVYFSWIIGVLLNPLGVHFGIAIIKELKNLK
jgi:hypothetical protein